MTDREKVINAIECCIDGCLCAECDYEGIEGCWNKVLLTDALALLKERVAEWIEYPECLAYDGAYSDSHIVCSACNHIFSTMDNCTEEFDYCPHSGAKMDE